MYEWGIHNGKTDGDSCNLEFYDPLGAVMNSCNYDKDCRYSRDKYASISCDLALIVSFHCVSHMYTSCAVGDYSGRFGLIESGIVTAVEKSSFLQIGQLAIFSIFIHGAGKRVCANIIPEYGEHNYCCMIRCEVRATQIL